MEINEVVIKGVHKDSFRPNELADIIGVVMLTIDNNERLCYKIKYISDSFIDFVPLSTAKDNHYIIEVK